MPAIFEYVRNLSESMLPPKVPHWTAWPGLRPASLNFRVSPEAISASAKWRGITYSACPSTPQAVISKVLLFSQDLIAQFTIWAAIMPITQL